MRRRLGIALGLLVALSVVLLVVVQVGPLSHRAGRGPLDRHEAGESTRTSKGADVGAAVTFGGVILMNRDSRPVVLDSVEPIRRYGDLEIVGIVVAGADRDGSVGTARGFPPESGLGVYYPRFDPVGGFVVPPATESPLGAQLLVGVKARSVGLHGFEAVRVTYHIGKRRYRTVLEDGFRVCAPLAAWSQGVCSSA